MKNEFKTNVVNNLDKYIFKGVEIEYTGFMMDGYYLFYGYFENNLLYLSPTQVKKLEKIK